MILSYISRDITVANRRRECLFPENTLYDHNNHWNSSHNKTVIWTIQSYLCGRRSSWLWVRILNYQDMEPLTYLAYYPSLQSVPIKWKRNDRGKDEWQHFWSIWVPNVYFKDLSKTLSSNRGLVNLRQLGIATGSNRMANTFCPLKNRALNKGIWQKGIQCTNKFPTPKKSQLLNNEVSNLLTGLKSSWRFQIFIKSCQCS